MKKLSLSITVAFNLFIIAYVSAQSTFQKCFGGPQFEYGYSMQKTVDEGCIVGGYTGSYGISPGQFYGVKFDMNGTEQWAKTYGGSCGLAQTINDVWQTTDGGYVFAGYSDCFTKGNTANMYIVRTDANGDTLWTRAWGKDTAGEYSDAYEITQAHDGNLFVGGYTTSYGAGGEDAVLLKLDKNTGDTLWTRIWGGPKDEWMYYLQETKDNGVYMCGFTTSFGAGGDDILVIKTDANGNIQWSKAYGNASDQEGYGHCAEQTKDGGYIIVSDELCLVKTDANGNIQWQKQYTGASSFTAHAVEQTTDGGYILGGRTLGAADQKAFLVKTDSLGNVLWSEEYGDTSMCYGVKQANDKGYYFTGQFTNAGNGVDAYLVKTDSNGISGCKEVNAGITASAGNYVATAVVLAQAHGSQTRTTTSFISNAYAETNFCLELGINQENAKQVNISLYPNPATDNITISFDEIEYHSVELYDITGRKLSNFSFKDKQFTFNCSSLSCGMYFIKAQSANGIKTLKFIKE